MGGKFDEFGKSSTIRQTKTITTLFYSYNSGNYNNFRSQVKEQVC